MRFIYDAENHKLYTHVFLHYPGHWWGRWWGALKYALGYKCKYGHFDEWMMRPEDVGRLKAMIERFEKDIDIMQVKMYDVS